MTYQERGCVNGDRETSRDFYLTERELWIKLLSARGELEVGNLWCNVAMGVGTTLSTWFDTLRSAVKDSCGQFYKESSYRDLSAADVRNFQADTGKARLIKVAMKL